MARLIEIKGTLHLSLTHRFETRDTVSNISITEAGSWLRTRLSGEFSNALLCTTQKDWQWRHGPDETPRLASHSPSQKQTKALGHDKQSGHLLDARASDWLRGLGVMDASNRVFPSMSDKYRQINKYLEIISHLAVDCGWKSEIDANSISKQTSKADEPTEARPKISTAKTDSGGARPITIADMGCGKGYLTFGVWHLVSENMESPRSNIGG